MNRKAKLAYLLPIIVLVFAAYTLPLVASAMTANTTNNVWDPTILKGPLVICTGDGTGGFACQGLCDLIAQVAHVIYFFIAVVIWIITPIMVAWSGISLIMSTGNPEAMKTAKDRTTGVVLGLVIVLCAYLVISIFVRVLGISGIGGFGGPACSV